MPHSLQRGHGHDTNHRNPQDTNAYLVGGGIASLAAAAFLIHDAHVPASQIHILESSPKDGGSLDGSGSPSTGYVLRGGRMLNFSYRCLYDLLATIPSLTDANVTVMDEILSFNSVEANKTHSNARLVKEPHSGSEIAAVAPGVVDVKEFGLSVKNREDLVEMMLEGELRLGRKSIQDCFDEGFFQTNFWYMWATMFAFQPWHSAVEFRRYLHRFIHEFPRINTLEGVDRTPYNQYDSIVLPIVTYLKDRGVDFRHDTKVTNLSYAKSDEVTVKEMHVIQSGFTGVINVHDTDVVLITLGSMTSASSLGTNSTPPSDRTQSSSSTASDGAWALWESLSHDSPLFGKPLNFSTRISESYWESFTVTLKNPEFFDRLTRWTHNSPGTGALVTFKDSSWLMSIVVPHQPHFLDQPVDVQVFWGYALLPSQKGNFVHKPMAACTGAEIFTELLGHLHFPEQPTLSNAITIPCIMPYITSQFLTRSAGDRPQVIPKGSTNLAFMGQFVEIPYDVVFTVEYSVRAAQLAVCGLMGLKKGPRDVYKGEHDLGVLARALQALLEGGNQTSHFSHLKRARTSEEADMPPLQRFYD